MSSCHHVVSATYSNRIEETHRARPRSITAAIMCVKPLSRRQTTSAEKYPKLSVHGDNRSSTENEKKRLAHKNTAECSGLLLPRVGSQFQSRESTRAAMIGDSKQKAVAMVLYPRTVPTRSPLLHAPCLPPLPRCVVSRCSPTSRIAVVCHPLNAIAP